MKHYHITDYQGSVVAVIRGDGVVEQRTHYYPYGEPWLEPEGDNRRLHTGKERLRWGSTSVHDFGARILPPAIPFWTTPDPFAEKYYYLGPYTFCAADPINHSDPSGCILRINMGAYYSLYECIDGEWGLYREGSKEKYTGGNHFADWVILALQYLQQGSTGAALIDFLVSDSEITTIQEGEKNNYTIPTKIISWRPEGSDFSIIETGDGYKKEDNSEANPYIYLAHEAGHSFDLTTRPDNSKTIDNTTNRESTSVFIENHIRFEHNLPLRVGYGHSPTTTTGAKIEMFPDKEYNKTLFKSNRYILKRIESQKKQRMLK